MESITDWLTAGVNTLLNGVMLKGFLGIMALSFVINGLFMEEQASNKALQEYTVYNQFDHKHAYGQDIVTAIFQYRGSPEVVVNDGTLKKWGVNSSFTPYSADEIINAFDQECKYDADLIKNKNGAVVSIMFRPCDNGVNCGGR